MESPNLIVYPNLMYCGEVGIYIEVLQFFALYPNPKCCTYLILLAFTLIDKDYISLMLLRPNVYCF